MQIGTIQKGLGMNGSNVHSNATNPFRIVRICIWMHLNASNQSKGIGSIWMKIRAIRKGFEAL